uniref:G-protein coupled receptors family 1 profile domain-containing protein n=1 Tax=Seriola lalandi dorsalis TaxID=1841481 RepID=A0A3B4YUV9_SERLL
SDGVVHMISAHDGGVKEIQRGWRTYILIICSNSTIVYLIWIHQNLHEPMYIFIAALLINAVLFSTVIYPKLFIDFLSENQIISYSACLFQYFMFYSLGGSEFLLLAAMAYDRYVSICKPLQYPTIMRKTTVRMFLVLAWLVPACQVAVPTVLNADKTLCNFTLKGIICNSTFYKLHCVASIVLNIYGLVVFANIVIFPTCLPHLLVLINFSCSSAYDVLLLRMETDFPKTVRFIMTLQMILYHPLFNPIIYGLKMKEIYKHLKRLFCPGKII